MPFPSMVSSKSGNQILFTAGSIVIYKQESLDYLFFLVGRLFPPEQFQELADIIHQSPQTWGFLASRWTLASLRQVCHNLTGYTLGGVYGVLRRLGLSLKRGQSHFHSPDPDYQAKVEHIKDCLKQARESQGEVVLLYGDEMSFYRQPSLARVWYPAGSGNKPRAEYSYHSNTRSRVMGVLDSGSGRVVTLQRSHADVGSLVHFLREVKRVYVEVKQIYLVWDNWRVHHLPEVLAAAQEVGITLVWLPTYAPWLNPIEKLWRWVRQEVIHMHRLSERWEELKTRVECFFQQFACGSEPLLHYVGLLPY